MKINKILICGMACLVLLTGCKHIPKLENGQDAIVTLSNGNISNDSLYEKVKLTYSLTSLIEMIDKQILTEIYGDEYSEDEKKQIESQIEYWLENYESEAALLKDTASYFGASTMEALREYLSLQYRRNSAVEDYVKENIKDDEIKKLYDEKIFGDIEASHILISPEVNSNMSTAEKTAAEEEALKKANEVISKLKNGEKFEDLAKEYSDDDSNKNEGGSLGYFSHGEMEEAFENAAKSLKVGDYTTTPVKTTYGYHIILKTNEKEKVKLDSIKSEIIEEIMEDKMEDDKSLNVTALVELRKKYKMDIQDSELKDQYDRYIESLYDSYKK